MRLVVKLVLVLAFVAVVPVTVSGVSSVVVAKDAVAHAAADALEAEARHYAELAETTILGSLDDLKQASLLGLDGLAPAERRGALWIIYRADAARTAVALFDGSSRDVVVDPVFQAQVGSDAGLADHEAFPSSALVPFAQHVPLDEALAAGKAVGVPYVDADRGAPFIVLAVRVPGPRVTGADGVVVETPWVVAVELSLRRLDDRFVEAKDEGLRAALVDLDGRAVCHTERARMLARASLTSSPGVIAMFSPDEAASGVANLDDDAHDAHVAGDDDVLVAWARIGRLTGARERSWGVVVERDRAVALVAVTQLQNRVVFFVGVALFVALLAGILLARGLTEPLAILTRVVDRFGVADPDKHRSGSRVRAPQLGGEIGTLASTFNTMADQIEARDRELRAFNDELQQRVEQRTAELKDAQGQLIDAQKMAAIGELGAGVAHEINNPLAAVLGSAQLALSRADSHDSRLRPHLEDIEKEALRIREIVENLLKLSQDTSQQAMGTVDVNAVVDGAVALMARSIIAARITLKKEFDNDLPRIRGRAGDLQQALLQVIMNARDAMPDGGTLTIRTDSLDGALVRIVVDDTGQGLLPANRDHAFEPFFTTRADAGHKGMGLAIVHRVVQEHAGRVVVESAGVFKGCTVRLSFPATRDARLL